MREKRGAARVTTETSIEHEVAHLRVVERRQIGLLPRLAERRLRRGRCAHRRSGASAPPAAAEDLLSISFAEHDRVRVQQLAERSESGALTAEEQEEFDSYLNIGNLLAVMQSKARIALGRKPHSGS